jgi:branched-chain amino acid transport system ATP-binding protein
MVGEDKNARTGAVASPEAVFRVENLNAAYGKIQVLWDVCLEIKARQIVALVGPNGAGKSTLLRTISGLQRPGAGRVWFEGRAIEKTSAREIVRAGLIHVPEGRRLFRALSVKENLLMGAYLRPDRAEVNQDFEKILELFPRLKQRLNQTGGTLSGGEQQMVAIGRGLMSRPRLLMIDELSLGLAPIIVEALIQTIRGINQEGLTVMIVEQDVQAVLEIADVGYVLESGHIVLSGSGQQLLKDDRVKQAYLGL